MNCVNCNSSTGALVDGLCVYCEERQRVAALEAKVSELTAENERLNVAITVAIAMTRETTTERIAKMLERRSDDLMHITTEGSTNRLAQEACAVALKKAAEAIRRGE